jgi:hypothetical protein
MLVDSGRKMNKLPTRRLFPATSVLIAALLSWAPLPPTCAAVYLIGDTAAGHDGMTDETVYKGQRLHLSATSNADGSWTGVAEFLDEPQPAITVEGFASQAEALDGALSRAMAKIDTERRFRGKPT